MIVRVSPDFRFHPFCDPVDVWLSVVELYTNSVSLSAFARPSQKTTARVKSQLSSRRRATNWFRSWSRRRIKRGDVKFCERNLETCVDEQNFEERTRKPTTSESERQFAGSKLAVRKIQFLKLSKTGNYLVTLGLIERAQVQYSKTKAALQDQDCSTVGE